jgi:hypothetical protein
MGLWRTAWAPIAIACAFDPAALTPPDASPPADTRGDAAEADASTFDAPPLDASPDAVWPATACWSASEYSASHAGHRYRFGTNARGFDGAHADECRPVGAYLVMIDDAAENDFVAATTVDTSTPWIGLRDEVEGQFHWMRDGGAGPPLGGYTNWEPGEPNDLLNEDCVLIFGNTGLWNDEDCGENHGYICECEPFAPP